MESKCFQVQAHSFHLDGKPYAFAGFPPKPLDISDRDRSIDSLGVRNGDTIIFQNLKPSATSSQPSSTNPSSSNSSTSSSSSGPPAPSLSKVEGPSEAKRQKTEIGAARMERQVISCEERCKINMIFIRGNKTRRIELESKERERKRGWVRMEEERENEVRKQWETKHNLWL